MRTLKTIIAFYILIVLTACNSGTIKTDRPWSELPEVTPLEKLKQTDFAPTLENPIRENKNIIYAPAFLYAWDKISHDLKSKVITTDSNSIEFKLLTNSKSFVNSLTDNEYSITVDYNGDEIIASAFFNKSLPFENQLQKLDDPIKFGKTNVSAFGMYYYDEKVLNFCKILYYQNDDHFILKLIPKDKQQEILLVKGLNDIKTLAAAVHQTNELIRKGIDDKSATKQTWKYEILREDIFSIPTLKFNIATNYSQLEGQTFKTADNKDFTLFKAYQRTGFILNENGAVVESEAEAAAALDSIDTEPELKHPKQMVFDKTFYIIIKRTNKSNPYFVMKVDNTELMTIAAKK